jgi:hypothetical protein
MTVYVDDMQREASVGGVTRRWSHLMADDPAELRAFAQSIGLRVSWVQRAGTYREHFDVTEAVRQRAIRCGAIPVRFEDTPDLHRAVRERARAKQASRAESA